MDYGNKSKVKQYAYQRHNKYFSWKTQMVKEHVKILFNLLNIVVHICNKYRRNCVAQLTAGSFSVEALQCSEVAMNSS